ncbi:uncharacterized protein LOC128246312 [Mya arenaria]|uniref:uncharacterized protein LOC128246312 n=1 Tax=Mya arenaria TaxID=6604 RepID=UPI0022E46420|nr:uncharacterized protein LOC128246312 [Mya arenaria]
MAMDLEYFHPLSLRLSRVLDDVGVSWRIMKRRRMTYLNREATESLWAMLLGKDVVFFYFGSQSEGTTSRGLGSDVDILGCLGHVNIMTDKRDWIYGKDNLFMIKEELTPPQHYLLQEIRADIPEPVTDSQQCYCLKDVNGRSFRSSLLVDIAAKMVFGKYRMVSSGPSKSISKDVDVVAAFKCRSLPPECQAWFDRPRPGHWPSAYLFRQARQCGCFLVPDGHPDSFSEHLEWRMTPNLVERLLMFSLNIIQLKCYVLLKMIKKCFFAPLVGDRFTSFHCKTVLFFTVERTPPALWKEHNLLKCVLCCIHTLIRMLKIGWCPHFIVSGVNLFDGKLQKHSQCKLYSLKTQPTGQAFRSDVHHIDNNICSTTVACCVQFLREEVYCVPDIMLYEMDRAIRDDLNHRSSMEQKWMDSAVVDFKPYLYYLQCLNFGALRLRTKQRQALENLVDAFSEEFRDQLHHPETVANLMGHCFEMKGNIPMANAIYKKSVDFMPMNNAANWHVRRTKRML